MFAWSARYWNASFPKSDKPSAPGKPDALLNSSSVMIACNTVNPPVPESNTPMGFCCWAAEKKTRNNEENATKQRLAVFLTDTGIDLKN